jgi:hypothetical protein
MRDGLTRFRVEHAMVLFTRSLETHNNRRHLLARLSEWLIVRSTNLSQLLHFNNFFSRSFKFHRLVSANFHWFVVGVRYTPNYSTNRCSKPVTKFKFKHKKSVFSVANKIYFILFFYIVCCLNKFSKRFNFIDNSLNIFRFKPT